MEKKAKLCLVDDDEIFQYMAERLFRSTNLIDDFNIFSNGEETINFLKGIQNEPDEWPGIILLDLSMPILDGWGFLEEYRKLFPEMSNNVTLYVVTSSIDPSDYEKARQANEVADFIIKPMTSKKLEYLLKEA